MHQHGRMYRLAAAILALVLLSACGQSTANRAATRTATEGTLAAIVAASELVVGSNRLPIGVVKAGTPVNDPNLKVYVRLFTITDETTAIAREGFDAVYRGEKLPFGLYVANVEFPTPGPWGLVVQMTEPGREPEINRLRVEVLPQASTPNVGSRAIATQHVTSKDVADLAQLTSDSTPDPDLYQMTIADALLAKQPFMVAFSTPGFCETAVCSPNLQVIKQLKDQYKGQINFIHVEVYAYPFSQSVQNHQFVPAMQAWNLRTEPWTFLVDGQGTIQAKYEGGITFAELEPALKQLAAGQPVQPVATQ